MVEKAGYTHRARLAKNAALKDRLANKEVHLADLRAEVVRLTHDSPPAPSRRGWSWEKPR